MNEIEHSHHSHGDPNGGPVSPISRPYWTRAHRDWKVWVGVILMVTLIFVYLMSDDLAWRPRLQAQQPVPGSVK